MMAADVNHQSLIPALPDDVALGCLMRVPFKHHSSLKSTCRRWNVLFSDSSFYEQRRKEGRGEDLLCLAQAVMVPGLSYPSEKEATAVGPTEYRLTIYNASSDTWSRLPESPLLLAGIPIFCQCVAVSGKLVVIGGWDPVTLETIGHVYVYDLITGGGWKRGASMSTPRSFFACAVIGSLVYVAGGHDGQKNALLSAEVYDPDGDTWHGLPDMSRERDESVGFTTGNGRFFWVLSGYQTNSQGRFDSSAEVYDRFLGVWTRVDPVWSEPHTRPQGICYVHENGKEPEHDFPRLWSVASWADGETQRGVREYDSREKRWKIVARTPEIIRSSPCVTAIAANGQLPTRVFVMATGYAEGEDVNCTALVMDVASKKWTKLTVPERFSGYTHSACSVCV